MISIRTRNVIVAILVVVGVISVAVLLAGCKFAQGSGQDPCAPKLCEVPASPATR